MGRRRIVEIDRECCDGCGLCLAACAEGALALDDQGKAVLVRDIYCDGMGVCLDVCPRGALHIGEREAPAYDALAAYQHVLETQGAEAAAAVPSGSTVDDVSLARSELTQWPIQLHLIDPQAPYFRGADLLVAADCTAFALGGFHAALLKGRKLVIACPKLDDVEPYADKLSRLVAMNKPRSITVAIMTVPCCRGLQRMVEQALSRVGQEVFGQQVPGEEVLLQPVVIDTKGEVVSRQSAMRGSNAAQEAGSEGSD